LQRPNPGVQPAPVVMYRQSVPSTLTANIKKNRGTMADLSLPEVLSLLGVQQIKGSEKELKMLCIRIGELVELNGEDWVRQNRPGLMEEWEYIVSHRVID